MFAKIVRRLLKVEANVSGQTQPGVVRVTNGIVQDVEPSKNLEHTFGLPFSRWRRLRQKKFVVTGGGTGFGKSMAIALAMAGAHVFIVGRRESKLLETKMEIGSLGVDAGQCHCIAADITDSSQIKKIFDIIASVPEGLCGVINNAAIFPRPELVNPLEDLPHEEWKRMLDTNVTAPLYLTRTLFPLMAKTNEVRVLFVSSEAGWAFTAGAGPYNVSKAALNNLGASMAEEYSANYPKVDVQMNVLVPGESRTEMNQGSTESPYKVVCMALVLLSHPNGGPNGKYFYRDGRHLPFAYAAAHEKPLL